MTMGPEPIRRIFCMSVRRGTDELFEDGVERMARSPAGYRTQLRGAADERRDIGRANERGIRLQFRVYASEGKDATREGGHVDAGAAGDVVGLARYTTLGERDIGAHHVLDVRE